MSSGGSFVDDVTKINQSYQPETPIRMVELRICKIDTLANQFALPDLIKIDVEGFELEVLKGAEGLLSNKKPALVIEIHPRQLELSGGNEAALFEFLESYEYSWTIIDRNPNSLDFRPRGCFFENPGSARIDCDSCECV
jgi:hypothetical protein